ncbi:MAG: pitrilysin family protein [Pseudomonadota bacterium]
MTRPDPTTASEAQLTTLPNGFRVATERIPGIASACVGVWVEAGSRHESEAENGIAHFLEHMAFKGTARRSAVDIAEEIEDVGGYLNAYTSRERTAYYARVMADDLPRAVDILADIVRHQALDPNEMELERGVILSEIGQVNDTPDDIIFDWLQETAFPDQPIGRSILGSDTRVSGFSPDNLAKFIHDHYRPARMILAAAGDVDHDAIVALAGEAFGDMAGGDVPDRAVATFVGGERRVDRRLSQAHFALGLRSPGFRDGGHYAAQIAATALGGGMSSRLFQEAREKRGLCYTIFAQAAAHEETGMLTVYAGTSASDLPALITLTAETMTQAMRSLNETEIARAKAQVRAGLMMGLEGASARAERLAASVAVWGKPMPVGETLERIEAVDVEGARAAVAGFLSGAPALALYGPVSGAEDAEALARRLAA